MILAAYELFSNGIDIIFSVMVGLMALFCLFAPYNLVKKVFPKASSPKVIRICAAVVLVIVIIGAIVSFIL